MDRARARTALPHVVIVGGGFGGVAAAKSLKHAPVRVTLIDRTNYHLFQPLLYQVAAGILEPGTITTPIRALFRHQKNVDVRMAEVTGIDKDRRQVQLRDIAETIPYDYLVLATGVHGSYFGHDEWAEFAPTMKTLAEAEHLRRQIIGALEQADQEEDPDVRAQWMTFVLVGAGPTGCELAGELAEHFRRSMPAEYRHIDPRNAAIILVEAGPRALATFSEDLARGAVDKLRSRSVWTCALARLSSSSTLTVSSSLVNAFAPAPCCGPRVSRRRPPGSGWMSRPIARDASWLARTCRWPVIRRSSSSATRRTSKTMASRCPVWRRWRCKAANMPRTRFARA